MIDAARPAAWRSRLLTVAILAIIASTWLLLERRVFFGITMAALFLTALGLLPWPPARRVSHGFGSLVALLARTLARTIITLMFLLIIWPLSLIARPAVRRRLSPEAEGNGWVSDTARTTDFERMF